MKRGLNQKGKKNELQARLKVGLESNVPLVENLGEKEASNIAGDVFDPIAHWELLEQDGEVMNEVAMGPHLHAPTQPEGEIAKVMKKNYTEPFDRPVFSGKAWIPKRWPSGGIARKQNGDMIWEKRPYEQSIPSYEFTKKHKLNDHSKPTDWFEAFLPSKNKKQDHRTQFTLEKVLSWTNFQARVLESAGLGGKYAHFTDFSLKEMKQHMDLYLFQGLSPSPQVEMKFASSG